jgi:TusA-related sulfurtransferase
MMGEDAGKGLKGMEEKEADRKGIKVASRIDAVGLFCPIPIVKLKQGLDQLKSKEIIEVLADDPGFAEDAKAWCEETGNRLLSLLPAEEGVLAAYVEKK